MQKLVGIIRTETELQEALVVLEKLKERAARVRAVGSRIYNPGWHLALDLDNLLAISEAVTRSALLRQESRGGHTREDHPKADPVWGAKNVIARLRDGRLSLTTAPLGQPPAELRPLLAEEPAPAAAELAHVERAAS
jgi:succinate dehydrogenase / fumarate reductase flavoprotein subunit